MINLLHLFFSVISPWVLEGFTHASRAARAEQERFLSAVIRKNENSRFGRDYHFSKIRSYADFSREVPIATYENLEAYIKRSMHGEPSQLTQENPYFFAMTSGTTGTPKFIPVTPENRWHKAHLMHVWLAKFFTDHPGIFQGKILTVVSPEEETRSPSGLICGAESGHGYRNMPSVMKPSFCCPYEIFSLEDYDAKYYTIVRIAAEQNITILYTCNPYTIILLAQFLDRYSEEIIKDIRDGTLSGAFKVPDPLAAQLRPLLKKNPSGALTLEKARRRASGMLLPKHAWPKLSGVGCWKGGNMKSYLDRFPHYFRRSMPVRDIGYFASEFRGSVPLSDAAASGTLAVSTNFYEFFPADAGTDPEGGELLRAHELERGKTYLIYVTTSAGLYRYDMNDVIEVTDFYHGAPVIEFIQKGKGIVSLMGEKLSEAQVIEAVDRALSSHASQYDFICAVGQIALEKPRYVFLIEFERSIEPERAQKLAQAVDRELSDLNCEYKAKRLSRRLSQAGIRSIKKGEFERFRRALIAQGRRDSQLKMVKLTDDAGMLKKFAHEYEVDGRLLPCPRLVRL